MNPTTSLLNLLLFVLLLANFNCLQPTRPIVVSPNTESSPSNFRFYFELAKEITPTDYLMIVFSPLSSANPLSCLPLGNSSVGISQCVNLNTASTNNQISVNTTWINSINPNIDSSLTVIIQFTVQLQVGRQYSIQIITDNVLPAIGSITSSIQFYTMTSTGFMLQQNWNFGQVFFQFRQNNILSVTPINSMTANLPGTLFSNLLFQITIAIQCPTSLSKLKLIISGDFQFSLSSLVNSIAVTSTAPQILSTEIISPNIIITTFNQSFAPGRKFRLSVTDILNPLKIASGFVSVYYLPYNSMSPISVKQLAIPISTVQYVPTLSVLTGQGVTPVEPIQFYTQNIQYITVAIILPRICDSNFVIQILTDTLTIQQGSVYAKTSTVQSAQIMYNHYTQKGVRISGFPQIPSGSLITVTMKVWIPSTPSFSVAVSIDKLDSLANPIMYGNTVSAITTVLATTFVTDLTGTQLQPLKLSSMITSATSNIQFVVNPSFSTSMGSSLTIFTSENVIASGSFSGSTSCVVNSVAATCSISTNSTLTRILIMSGSSNNLFPQSVPISVVISNIQFKFLSSTSQYIHQFYFMLTVSEATNAAVRKMVIVPQVIPQRNTMTNFGNYFCNDLNNTGTNYPNIFRVVSSDSTQWQYTIQSRQRRLISIFAKNGWRNLFSTLDSGDSYPILSSLTGVTSKFIQGTTYYQADQYPLNWDKVDLILPGTQSTTKFSIALPTTFISSSALQFQILVGIYNIDTRLITYLYIQPRPILTNPTYKATATAPVSSKPKQLTTKLQLAGFAGSYKNSVQVTVTPASGTFSGTTYSTSLIILSTWPFFDSTSTFSTSSMSSVNPLFSNTEQTPLSIQMSNGDYLSFIPFKTVGVYASQFSIYLDSIKLPYGDDLPYYSISLIDESGSLDSYNEFINQDQGVFYSGNLKQISFACSDNSLGAINTDCTINFMPNQQLQIQSTIYLVLTGLTVSTDQCVLTFVSNSSQIPLTSCVSNTDKNQIVITLANTIRLSGLVQYSLQIFGMGIQSSTIIHFANMTIRDPSGSYIIEKGTRILMTTVSTYFPIYIDQVTYFKNNPIVVSGFFINFQLPRNLYKDEVFAVVLSNDLSNLNSIPSKMRIKLFDIDNGNTEIQNLRWFINSKNYQIIFQDLHQDLGAFNYRMEIYGILTPSSISTDTISLIFMRFYDSTYTVQNTLQSTSQFPSLVDKSNSLITFQSLFNTQGLQQPLTFTIQPQYAQVNDESFWYISLPRYYSQDIWNQDYLIYCRISGIQIKCGKDPNIPYTINIWKSPLIIDIGTTYTLQVYGIVCPRATYLNGNANYVTQSIFLGMAQSQQSESYVQYSELFMTTSIIDPESEPGYGSIIVSQVISSNSQTFQTTFFSVNLVCNVAISSGNWIYFQFPQGFDNFNDISMQGNLIYLANTMAFTSQVSNVRVGFQVSGITIPSNAKFTIQIASLPTPKTVMTIDMNKLKVVVSSSDKTTTIASTLQLHNLASSISFTQSGLHLAINTDNIIQITAGTYSQSIRIYPSDFVPFLSNIKVQFISTALDFSPQPTYLLQGNSYGEFRVGADQTIIPTVYNYQIIKSQTSISAYYTALSLYAVKVTNYRIPIDLPSTISIPRGGCSIPVMVSIDNPPYSDVSVNFEYDSTTYTLQDFWINQETSYTQLEFTTLILDRQLSFCTSSRFSATTLPINVFLLGSNKNSYELSDTTINIVISSNASTNIVPTATLTTTNVQKTFASFNLNVNLNGFAYYELNLAPFTPLNFTTLKQYIKQQNQILQSQKDFLNNQIYTSDRDYRVDLIPVASGINQINFQNLLPERPYTLCIWFENQHRVFAQQVCNNFTLQSWGLIKKFKISFNSKISQSQLNSILCFFSKASNSQITQVMDLEGKSCSLNSAASNYNYNYRGSTHTLELYSTFLYHISDYNLTTDPSTSAFTSLYNSTAILQTSLDVALSNFSINFISSSTLSGSFEPLAAINIDSSSFMPVVSFTINSYVPQSYTQYLKNMKLSQTGAVYLILTSFKTIIKDQITGHTDINIRPIIIPTSKQILNCLDGYGQVPIVCKRVMLKIGDTIDVSFSELNQNNMYAVFYVVANEYPLRPIVYGGVQSQYISTIVLQQATLIIKLLGTLAFLILMIA